MKFFKINIRVIFSFILLNQVAITVLLANQECIVRKFSGISRAIETCNEIILDNITVPAGKSLNLDLQDGTKVYFRGATTFEYAVWEGPLVAINGTNVTIVGEKGAILDGQGQLYWDGNGEWGSLKPKFFIMQLHNSTMSDIYVKNSPIHCVLLADSTDVQLYDWTIDNKDGDPENVKEKGKYGHNTDGFDIWNSTNVIIKNGYVYNQDDCIALRCGANILVDNLYCHGTHGLSISVGFSNDSISLNTLQNVTIRNSILHGGENGIHVKTHVDGGNGLIKNVTYENIVFSDSSKSGINLQQNYRNLPANSTMPSEPTNNIPIRNLILRGIYGSVQSKAVPIYIVCADEGCFDWDFTDVSVHGGTSSNCNYVPTNFTC